MEVSSSFLLLTALPRHTSSINFIVTDFLIMILLKAWPWPVNWCMITQLSNSSGKVHRQLHYPKFYPIRLPYLSRICQKVVVSHSYPILDGACKLCRTVYKLGPILLYRRQELWRTLQQGTGVGWKIIGSVASKNRSHRNHGNIFRQCWSPALADSRACKDAQISEEITVEMWTTTA